MFPSSLILLQIVQLVLFIVNSGCTKHMTGNLKLLCNFVEKYLGTVRFGNDQFAPIPVMEICLKGMSQLDGFITSKASITIFSRLVNYVISDLEVAFRKSTCYVIRSSEK
ncbi:hypothetical protein Tco_0441453 [Tanacetum coccineum]